MPNSWTIEQRLAHRSKVDPLTGCHLWLGALNASGYARFGFHGPTRLAHRIAWTLRHGPIPKGMDVCHRCDRRHCINPDHHFLDSRSGNMRDFARKRRARIERAFADERGHGGIPVDAGRNDLVPIRFYVGGVEIVGEAVIRTFDPSPDRARLPALGGERRWRPRQGRKHAR